MRYYLKIRERLACVYWPPLSDYTDAGYTGFGGIKHGNPIQIRCYWINKDERIVTGSGEEVTSKATILPNRLVVLGGVLWLGLLVDAPRIPPKHQTILSVKVLTHPRRDTDIITARI